MFKSLIPILMIASAHAGLINVQNCQEPQVNEPIVYSDDFGWGLTLKQIKAKEDFVYQSGKRLKSRAYLEEGKLVLPYTLSRGIKKVRLNALFIKSISKHIEEGLKRKYVDSIVFADMGHSHIFIPEEFYEKEIATIPLGNQHLTYEKIFSHSEIKILYHTAEQLKMLDKDKKLLENRHLQWRFFTRNLIGDNKGLGHLELIHQEDHSYNTAGTYQDGYRYWGAGYNISASKDGCFSYMHNGEEKFFDISLYDLEPSNMGNDDVYF